MCCIKNEEKVHIVHIFHIYFSDTLYPLPPHFYFNNNKYYKNNIYYYWEEERVSEGVYVENVEYVYYVYLVFFGEMFGGFWNYHYFAFEIVYKPKIPKITKPEL